MTEQEGLTCRLSGEMRLGKHESCFPPQTQGGRWAERQPFRLAQGRGPETGLPLRSSGQCFGEPGLALESMGKWGQEGGAGASCPRVQGYQSTAPSRFP